MKWVGNTRLIQDSKPSIPPQQSELDLQQSDLARTNDRAR